ncbi:MAG: hypothetical protein ACYDG3_12170 [Bacillati bacterium]
MRCSSNCGTVIPDSSGVGRRAAGSMVVLLMFFSGMAANSLRDIGVEAGGR